CRWARTLPTRCCPTSTTRTACSSAPSRTAKTSLTFPCSKPPASRARRAAAVCPPGGGTYRRYQQIASDKGGEREFRYERPERLYDLNCQVDIPVEHFFVVAPAPEVKW